MVLIHPPVAKPGEPPAGIARLAGALGRQGIPCTVLDANIEGLLYLLHQPHGASDTWSRRALRNVPANIAALQDRKTYQSPARYARAVGDLRRVLAVSGGAEGIRIGLADYQHPSLSPLRSADLLHAAEHPEENPFSPYFKKRLPAVLAQGRTQMVGISINYLSQALCAFALIGLIRKEFPCLTIILGGGLVSSWMKRPGWKNPFGGLVDHLIDGPGERPLLSILGRKDGDQAYGVPDYRAMPLHDYLAPGLILPYSASSGCYWGRCAFCPETAENHSYCPLPGRQVTADLRRLVAEQRPALIHLLDNAISPAHLQALAEDPPGAPWYGFARIGPALTDGDFCRTLKRSGCTMLELGIESGDQVVLDAMHKGIKIAEAEQVLENLKRAGIAAYVYLLFGAPAETLDAARRTLDFVVRRREAISFLNLAIFNMPIGGPEAGAYETEQFYEGDLSLYTGFCHPRGWDRRQVRRFLDHEFRRHSAIAPILKRDPPVFTSNHAAFFVSTPAAPSCNLP